MNRNQILVGSPLSLSFDEAHEKIPAYVVKRRVRFVVSGPEGTFESFRIAKYQVFGTGEILRTIEGGNRKWIEPDDENGEFHWVKRALSYREDMKLPVSARLGVPRPPDLVHKEEENGNGF